MYYDTRKEMWVVYVTLFSKRKQIIVILDACNFSEEVFIYVLYKLQS